MLKNHKYLICCFLGVLPIYGQDSLENFFINQGTLVVEGGVLLSTTYGFTNTEKGIVKNDGEIHYHDYFQNDNLYYYSTEKKSSKTSFIQKGKVQQLRGGKLSEFYDVQFDNPDNGFALDTDFKVGGKVDFSSGVVKIDSVKGGLLFAKGSSSVNVSDKSHADGYVEKQGNESFVYPIGNKGLYRRASISAPEKEADLYRSKYVLEGGDFFKTRSTKSGVLEKLNTSEYWSVTQGKGSSGDIMLTLSWDDRTTVKELLDNPEKELHIVRWDSKQNLWVDQGGVVDLAKKEITTATSVSGYGYFTLATVNVDLLLKGDVVIYNLVSPNGDGKNDYFTIDNIHKYPNNTVEIYNRWGVKVYDTMNYNSQGNVFKGYSEGRVTVDKNDKLPSGTYFYIITYEYRDSNGSEMIKKSGYLHLENGK